MRISLGSALLLGAAACATHAGSAPVAAPCPAAVIASAAPVTELYDLSWQLELDGVGRDLPDHTQAFAVERWECALGPVQYDDVREAASLQLVRTRRLACTHASGATVQTALRCTLASSLQQPSRELPPARALPLTLDTAAPVGLTCTPRSVPRLVLATREAQLGALCVDGAGIRDCPSP